MDKRRAATDIMKLMETHEVKIIKHMKELYVKFYGPTKTPYADGVWTVRISLPDNYPFKSPCINFINKIYHPNIDEESGAVCLDALNQEWSALYNLSNIIEIFLPQLLSYPNPNDPLNLSAGKLYMQNMKSFERKVNQYVERYANKNFFCKDDPTKTDSDSESSLSGDDKEDEGRP